MLNILTVKETIENIVDELNRATTRLKEIGDIQTDTITPDEELISDMEMSIERMQDIYQDAHDVGGLALIMACYGGSKADELFGLNIDFSKYSTDIGNISGVIICILSTFSCKCTSTPTLLQAFSNVFVTSLA